MYRIMTLNTNYYEEKHGSWQQRRELIVDLIRRNQPDVIALQAVRQDPRVGDGINQAEQLSSIIPEYPTVIFQQAAEFPDGSTGGSAVLARQPLLETDHIALNMLEGLEDNYRRVLLKVRVSTRTGPLSIYNAHFSWVEQQAEQNIREVLPFLGPSSQLGVLLGDFNTPSDSRLLDILREAGWRDAWGLLHPGEDGFTFEAPAPTLRIDYIWLTRPLVDRLVGIEILSNEGKGGSARLSDHFGLLVELNL